MIKESIIRPPSFTYHQKLILSLNFVYMSLFNVMYVLCRGRAVTNVGKTCGPTPCLMLAINTFKLKHLALVFRFETLRSGVLESWSYWGVGLFATYLFATHTLSRPDLFAAYTFATCTCSLPDIFATCTFRYPDFKLE